MFKREHHLHIATILQALDSELLLKYNCLFGGGTAIALSHDEFRESVDIDFLISDISGYQNLRETLKKKGLMGITRSGMKLETPHDLRADQYGIRTLIPISNTAIKFEIIFEGRIKLDPPSAENRICGIYSLTETDRAASKLLALSDRWADDSTFSRDLIDLAMLNLPKKVFHRALDKATGAYGASVIRDLTKAIIKLSEREGRLDECMAALKIVDTPKALLWKRIRSLKTK